MAGDANYASVSSLLHFEGADGSTTITDEKGKVWTRGGSSTIVTAQYKFGASSLLCNASANNGASTPSHADFDLGAGDFTLEFFARFNSVTGNKHLLNKYPGASGTAPFAIYQSGSAMSFYSSGNGTTWNLIAGQSLGTGLSTGVWYHFAVTRAGDTWRTFRDGALIATSGTVSGAVVSNSGAVTFGYSPTSAEPFDGWLDELRITKGVARYTAAFTPPTAAFVAGLGQVSGVIRDSANALCARTVRAYRRDTGALAGSAISDAITGAYSIDCPTLDEVSVIALDDAGGTFENDRIIRVVPS